MKKVGIVMGSDSDLPILRKTMDTLTSLGIPYECHIYSAHRTPEEARDFAVSARANGFGALIAAAGMAAHLAGAIAANTTLPVIGIPCKGPCFHGHDALRYSGGHRSRKRGRECRFVVRPDSGSGGRGACREAGRQTRRRRGQGA